MICHEYKCIYIHQRKAAGSSIIRAFGITPDQAEWRLFNEGTLSFSRRHGRWRELPHVNATPHEPYPTYYDDTTREAVGSLFQRDIEEFGYEFECGP